VGCYLVVWDSGIEDVSETTNKIIKKNRPWARGNNPKTALIEYLDLAKNAGETYQINSQLRTKIGISSASDAFLRKVGKGQ
jgi:cephalosporin hydroxylase